MNSIKSNYKGLYVQRLGNGEIFSVQIVDPSGHSIPLDPQEYRRRGILPPLEQLSNNVAELNNLTGSKSE